MNSYVLTSKDVIENINTYDKADNHLIISNDFDNIFECITLVQYAEISILLAVDKDIISNDLIEICNHKRLIIYLYVNSDQDLLRLKEFIYSDIDYVLLLTDLFAQKLSENQLKMIVNYNINISVIKERVDYFAITDIYNAVLFHGFSSYFSVIETTHDLKITGCICRNTLSQFNYSQNINISNKLNDLKSNALRRYNKALSIPKNINIEILFVNIEIQYFSRCLYQNLGIEYLASVLNKNGHFADTVYLNKFNVISELEKIISINDIKIIGFSCMQDNMNVIIHTIKVMKEKYKNVTFFVGGAQAYVLDKAFLQNSNADYIMVGESENIINPFVENILSNNVTMSNISNLRYIDQNGQYVETPKEELIQKLDDIPFPNYVYKHSDELTTAGIITGRGCPYKCAFCYEGSKERTVRYRSVTNVLEEISVVMKNHKNVKRIQFFDDTFTLDPSRITDLCYYLEKLYKQKGLTWLCEMHCQTVYNKPELVKLMVDSGLVGAQIGLESGNNDTLSSLNKKITTDMILKTVENCQKAGLHTLQGNILIGAVCETEEHLKNNMMFIEHLLTVGIGMLDLNISLFWPFPHTPIEEKTSEYGIEILHDQYDYSIRSMSNIVTQSKVISREEYIEYMYMVQEHIDSVCKKLCLQMNADEAKKFWLKGRFNESNVWGRALNTYPHMRMFFGVSDNDSISMDEDENVFPVRTFDLLVYKDGNLIIPQTDVVFNDIDTKILELCNGRYNVGQISNILKLDIEVLFARLKYLQMKMCVYGGFV